MAYFNTLFWLTSAILSYYFSHGSALEVNGIFGGYIAPNDSFTYQVAVVGRVNGSISVSLLCNGGIISSKLVVTAAQCLFKQYKVLKEITFSVTLHGVSFISSNAFGILITSIFIPEDHGPLHLALYKNNIAVGMLAETLNFTTTDNQQLSRLFFPDPTASFEKELAVLAGYEDMWIANTGYRPTCTDHNTLTLKYTNIRILSNTACLNNFFSIPIERLMCGLMMSGTSNRKWRLNPTDAGSPLVFEGTIIGVATYNLPDLNELVLGALYTKIIYFSKFLNDVLFYSITNDSSLLQNILTYYNRRHVII